MRLLICAGGTGGGVYPALAVLQALRSGAPDKVGSIAVTIDRHQLAEKDERGLDSLEILWVGSAGGMEVDLLTRVEVPLTTIPAAGVHGVGWRALPGNLWRVFQGFLAARRIIQKYHPEVMLFTGGYVAVPMALAGRIARRKGQGAKILLLIPDIEPGLALRVLARFADHIALSTEESMSYFSGAVPLTVTGYPTRKELVSWTREEALRRFNLSQDLPVLLIFGGSKGAHSINQAVLDNLSTLLDMAQLIHISGHLDWEMVKNARQALSYEQSSRYQVYPYLHEEMGAALRAADLVISRAGASILGEFPLFGLPAVLVPYPHAWRYQQVNASYLEKQGAAIVVQDEVLSREIAGIVKGILTDRHRLHTMHLAMSSLARPQAAEAIAQLIFDLASPVSQGRN